MSKDKKAVLGSCNGDIQSLQACQESKQQQESYLCMQNVITSLQRVKEVLQAASPEPFHFFLVRVLPHYLPQLRVPGTEANTTKNIEQTKPLVLYFQVNIFVKSSYFDLDKILKIKKGLERQLSS